MVGRRFAAGPKRHRSFGGGRRRSGTWIALAALGLFAAAPLAAQTFFPLNSELRLAVNAALLKLTENGTYQQINDKWFGKPEG